MKALIIEDSTPVARMIQLFLEPLTDEITITSDMRTALEIMEKAGPIELITLDLTLPDSGSMETLRNIPTIRKRQPDSLLVIVTGGDVETIKHEAIELGADGLMMKQGDEFTPQGFMMMLNLIVGQCIKRPRHFSKSLSTLEAVATKLAALLPSSPSTPAAA